MPGTSSTPPNARSRGALVGAVVIGLIVVAFLAATVAAWRADTEAQRSLLTKIAGGLALLFVAVPRSRQARSERARLLELGWTLLVCISLAFAAAIFGPFGDLLQSLWGYVFLAVALGMVAWGHSLPKDPERSSDP